MADVDEYEERKKERERKREERRKLQEEEDRKLEEERVERKKRREAALSPREEPKPDPVEEPKEEVPDDAGAEEPAEEETAEEPAEASEKAEEPADETVEEEKHEEAEPKEEAAAVEEKAESPREEELEEEPAPVVEKAKETPKSSKTEKKKEEEEPKKEVYSPRRAAKERKAAEAPVSEKPKEEQELLNKLSGFKNRVDTAVAAKEAKKDEKKPITIIKASSIDKPAAPVQPTGTKTASGSAFQREPLAPIEKMEPKPDGGPTPASKDKILKVSSAIEYIAANYNDFTVCDLSNKAVFNMDHCKELAEALKTNTFVQELNLSGDRVTNQGCEYLAEMLKHNTSLRTLNLENNKIDSAGIQALAEALAYNKSLLTLILLRNKEPGEGALSVLVKSFQYNTILQNINWRLTSRQSFAINKCLTRNKEIERRLLAGMDISHLDPNVMAGEAATVPVSAPLSPRGLVSPRKKSSAAASPAPEKKPVLKPISSDKPAGERKMTMSEELTQLRKDVDAKNKRIQELEDLLANANQRISDLQATVDMEAAKAAASFAASMTNRGDDNVEKNPLSSPSGGDAEEEFTSPRGAEDIISPRKKSLKKKKKAAVDADD